MTKKDKKVKKIKDKKKDRRVSIGGQAVLEGVMMRGERSIATAVRDQDGIIRVESKRLKPRSEQNWFLKLPLVRGVVSFFSSLVTGTKILMRSADVYGEGEPGKFEKWCSEKLKVNVANVVAGFSMILGLALAIILFILLPQLARRGLESLFHVEFSIWAKNFIEGGFKLLIFIGYILLSSCMKDIRRTFMYHGAEHKTISCYERGLELTPENAKTCSRVHDRCGTTFMVFVMLISIILFAVVESLIGVGVEKIYRVLLKLALLPVVAGLSYELLKGLAKTTCWVFFPLKAPGLLLQRITTREPDLDMLEVAITAFNTVLAMDNDLSIPEQTFVTSMKRKEILSEVKEKLHQNGINEEAEAEWIVSLTLNIKRDEVSTDNIVTPKYIEKIRKLTEERISGRPLWYCVGDTDFYGNTIKVDERVLIPRPETEILVEQALKVINKDSSVLDLCTGSGAIAIAIKKEKDCSVTASDVSLDAISLATENASQNGCEIEFIESDLFDKLNDRKFDCIISNPPYIKKADIDGLQKEVRDFEPIIALDGGEDGLDFYRRIAKEAKSHLNENGVLLMECGFDQAQSIKELLTDYKEVEIIKDYENIDRIIKAVL